MKSQRKISLGVTLPHPILDGAVQIETDEPLLKAHLDKIWFRSWLHQEIIKDRKSIRAPSNSAFQISSDAFAMHTLIVGGSGYGKSRCGVHLISEQIRDGCSAVILDPKRDTLLHILSVALKAGLKPEQIIFFSPGAKDGVPGSNPFLTDLPIAQIVADLVSVYQQQSGGSWGPRLQDLLTNALLILAGHRLSLYELPRLLNRDEYRANLLQRKCAAENQTAYQEARIFFQEEYRQWTRSERTSATAPVLNKIRETLRSDFFQACLCARRNTMELASLWEGQRLVLVHLDRPTLGEEGTRLLAGLFSSLLFRTAQRATGETPVVLCLDELATLEKYIGEAICETVTFARSFGLRLLVACQHFEQLPPQMRAALLGNTATQLFFHVAHGDARQIAAAIATGLPSYVKQVSLGLVWKNRSNGQPDWQEVEIPLYSASKTLLSCSPNEWSAWKRVAASRSGVEIVLNMLSGKLKDGGPFLEDPETGRLIPANEILHTIVEDGCWLEGPDYRLVIRFPRPKVLQVERSTDADSLHGWERLLMDLRVQHAVVRSMDPHEGSKTHYIKIADVDDKRKDESVREFLSKVINANGQSEEEIAKTTQWRREFIEQLDDPKEPIHQISAKTSQKESTIEAPLTKKPERQTLASPSIPTTKSVVSLASVPLEEDDDDGSLS